PRTRYPALVGLGRRAVRRRVSPAADSSRDRRADGRIRRTPVPHPAAGGPRHTFFGICAARHDTGRPGLRLPRRLSDAWRMGGGAAVSACAGAGRAVHRPLDHDTMGSRHAIALPLHCAPRLTENTRRTQRRSFASAVLRAGPCPPRSQRHHRPATPLSPGGIPHRGGFVDREIHVNRRHFIRSGAIAASLALPAIARATTSSAAPVATPAAASALEFAPTPETGWRRFEVTTRVEPLAGDGATRVWVPLPAMNEADWQRPMGNLWKGNADFMTLVRDSSGAEMLYAEWAPGSAAPELEVVSRFATRDRSTDFANPSAERQTLPRAQHALYTRAT